MCSILLYVRGFPLGLKKAVYMGYVSPAMCRVNVKDKKEARDVMLGLNKTISVGHGSVYWYGHLLRD